MRKPLKLLPFCLVLFLWSSCETTKESFQNALSSRPSSNSPEAEREFNRLTRNGTTLPAAQEVTRVVSNPGDVSNQQGCIQVEPASARASAPRFNFKGGSPFRSNSAPNGADPKYGVSLKNHPRPERGCYPVENVSLDEAKAAIASQNFSVAVDRQYTKSKAPSDMEIRTFGAAIKSVQYLNGGVFTIGRPARTYPFEYCDHVGASSQQFGNRIRISRKGNAAHGLSVAQYVHEWSHQIGNSPMPGTGKTVYQAFKDYIGGEVATGNSRGQKPCLVSMYSDNRTNEHFAEAFTAFVTEPTALLRNSRSGNKTCKKAYDFFAKKLFKKGERAKECY